jgi:hypothetical protein
MKLVDKVAIVLAVLAVFSAAPIALSTINYIRNINDIKSVQLELSSLELRDEGNPEVLITFHLKNGSPMNMTLEYFRFGLYLNGEFMGSTYVPFTERSLAGFEETTMHFVVLIRPFYLRRIEQARQKEDFSWSVRGRAKLQSPFWEKGIWLNVSEHWSGY